jgi:adhesin/invasin
LARVVRSAPLALPRVLAALALGLAVVTCRDAFEPGSTVSRRIAIAPILPSEAMLTDFGLTIDAVRFVVVRPPSDTLADTTLALHPDSTELALDLHVALISSPETLSVSVLALSGTLPLFSGTELVPVPSELPPTEIPVDTYVGPVADSIVIVPRSPFILLNDSLRFQVQGFDSSGVPVTQFYIAWSSSDSAVAPINRFGVLRAPGTRAAVRVVARTPSGASDSVTATFTPPATQLVLVSGGGQTDTVGSPLATPLAVEARAADGIGVGGVAVRFRSVSGGGAVADSLVMTDAAGRASTSATLGGGLGPQSFEASVSGLAGSPVTFIATALAGPPTQLLATAGDAQVTTVATPVSTPPAVVLKDAGGNPVAGASVTFTIASGGGGITGSTQTTDASGAASVGSWTLGSLAGANTLTASAAGLTRTFTATGVADSATQLVATAGDLQSALVGTAVATDPTVRAQDQFGNAVAGASITFAVSGGGGRVAGAAQLTNGAGIATVGSWTLGTTVGANALQASLSGVTPVTFTATGTAGTATGILKLAGDAQTGTVNAALGTAPRVKLVDQFGNPVAGAGVTFAVIAGGGSVGGATQTTDTGGVATVGSWTLGTGAGPNELTAAAGALTETFSATGVAGPATQIAALIGNSQSAVVNTVLPIDPVVIVRDQFNNPVAGATVTFAASGNGSVTGASQTTDAAGVAAVGSWRLATTAGSNTLSATSGLLGTSFTATGVAAAATQLVKTAGDGVTAVVGSLVGPAPAVQARDQFGNAVSGLIVTFAVTTGAGTVTGATDTTGASGVAAVGSWTLDTIAGGNALTATAGALSAVFAATGTAGAPTLLVKTLGDAQTAVVNTALPAAPTVRLVDRYGNSIAGATIEFHVIIDGGSVADTIPVTDAGGVASAGPWTIADFVALNRLLAVVQGVPAVPAVQFTAQGTHDVAFQILRETVDTQTAIAGQAVSVPPAVRVRDQFFNPVPGVSVSFTLTGALQGSVSPASAITDASGLAQVTTWTVTPTVGLNTLEAAVPGLVNSPIVFSATGVTTTATSMALGPAGGGNGQTAVVGSTLPVPYSVRVLDIAGAPVQNVLVAWTAGPSSGAMSSPTSLTDLNGVATSTHSLGAAAGTQTASASVGGLSGSPVLFTTTALADTAAILVKVSADPQNAPAGTPVSAPVVRVTDLFDNPLSGVVVSFSLTSGGVLGATLDTTDAAGLATAGTWTLDTQVGTDTVTVGAGSLFPAEFTAVARAGTAAAVVMVDGDGQTGTAGGALPQPYRVRVTDAFGNGVRDAIVNWSIDARASGGIDPAAGPTDTAGIAAAIHTLGNTVGPHSAFAWVTGIADTVTFTSTAAAGAAAQIFKQAGDTQTAIVNTAVGAPITVLVTDQFGAPVAGHAVTWAVTSGGGSLGAPVTVVTDIAGIATAPVWTLGTAAGSNGLNASAAGLTGSPVAFTATGRAGSATQMAIKDGNGQSATVGTAVAIKPSVILKDQFNNLVAGAPVVFAVLSGGGTVTGGTDTTDAQGVAAVGSWTVGTLAGLNTLRANSAGVQPRTFTATGLAGAPVQLAFVTEPSRSLAGDTIKPPVRVAIQDLFGNTVLPITDVVHLDLGAIASPGAKLLGTLDVAAVNGVALFPDLTIDSAGIGYTLLASTPKVAGNEESAPFDVGGVIAAFADDRLNPVAAAFNPANGFVYVPGGDGETRTLGVLDPSKGLLTLLPILQTQPFGVAVNAQTNRVYVTTFAVLTGAVVVIDGRNDTPIGLIPLPGEARGIAVDEGTDRAFVAVGGDPGKGEPPALAIIDGKDNRVIGTILFPEGMLPGIGVAFNPNDRLVYVAIPNVGVGLFDPEQAQFVGAISIVGGEGAAETYGVAIDVRTNLLFATNRAEHTVSVIDLTERKEVTRLQVGRDPEGLGVDGDRGAVYVGNSGENTVSFIDVGKLEVTATLIVGPAPKAAAVDPGSGRFFVPTFLDDRVRLIQP